MLARMKELENECRRFKQRHLRNGQRKPVRCEPLSGHDRVSVEEAQNFATPSIGSYKRDRSSMALGSTAQRGT